MTPLAITALVLVAWSLVSVVLGLAICRAIPRSPEPHQHESATRDPELNGLVVPQAGSVDQFHTGSNRTQEQRNHG